jgi:hypothetical protein
VTERGNEPGGLCLHEDSAQIVGQGCRHPLHRCSGVGQERIVALDGEQSRNRPQEHRWVADRSSALHGPAQQGNRLLGAPEPRQGLRMGLHAQDFVLDAPMLSSLC